MRRSGQTRVRGQTKHPRLTNPGRLTRSPGQTRGGGLTAKELKNNDRLVQRTGRGGISNYFIIVKDPFNIIFQIMIIDA